MSITLSQAAQLGRIAAHGGVSKGTLRAILTELQVYGPKVATACAMRDRQLAEMGGALAPANVDQAVDRILVANNIHPTVRNSDSLDFHDLSVVHVRRMLEAAFAAGAASVAEG